MELGVDQTYGKNLSRTRSHNAPSFDLTRPAINALMSWVSHVQLRSATQFFLGVRADLVEIVRGVSIPKPLKNQSQLM